MHAIFFTYSAKMQNIYASPSESRESLPAFRLRGNFCIRTISLQEGTQFNTPRARKIATSLPGGFRS
jgi:hypothetical protein